MRKSDTVAHGVSGTEETAKEVLSVRGPDLEAVLKALSWLWRVAFVVPVSRQIRRDGTLEYSVLRLAGVTPRRGFRPEQLVIAAEMTLRHVYAIIESQLPLQLHPLVQYTEASSGQPEVFLFDEVDKHEVILRAYPSGQSHPDPEALIWLRAKSFVETRNAPDIPHAWMMDITRRTLGRLIELKRYGPESTIAREETEAVLRAFVQGDRPLLILDGPAGSGKTTFLCHVANQRMAAGEIVLLETIDRLVDVSFPEALGPGLGMHGEIATTLAHLKTSSTDNRVLVALDDLGVTGQEEGALLSLFRWIERLPSDSPIRIVATIRSDRLRAFLSKRGEALPPHLVQRFEIPPCSSYELVALAEKLPVPSGTDPELLIAIRRQVAKKIGEIADSSARRPGLAVVILELVSLESVPASFSAARAYDELFRREVLHIGVAGLPLAPRRGALVRRVAEVLLKSASTQAALDDDNLIPAHLIDAHTGERSVDYQALLSNDILVETFEDYVSYVSFADPRFFEYIAVLNLPIEGLQELVLELCQQSKHFPPALSVVAFYLIRTINRSSAASAWKAIEKLAEEFEPLLLEIASLDAASFLGLFDPLSRAAPWRAESMLTILIRAGEPGLADRAAQILIECVKDNPDQVAAVRFLRVRALYDLDEYDAADEELMRIGSQKLPRVLALQGEVAAARGDFAQARSAYEAVLEKCPDCGPEERATALSGLGYVLGRMGLREEAEKRLLEAIEILEQQSEDSPLLSEVLGDLGQLLGELGRTGEARQYLEKSLAIVQRRGHLPGIGVVEGHLGEIDIVEGKTDQAEIRLRRSLEIARRVGNRWREIWVLGRLARLRRARGQCEEADRLLEEARKLSMEIGLESA